MPAKPSRPTARPTSIDVKSADNFAARLFIDEQTHLPLMVTYKAAQPRMMTQASGARPVASGGGAHTVTMSASMSDEEKKKAQADMEKQVQRAVSGSRAVMVDYTRVLRRLARRRRREVPVQDAARDGQRDDRGVDGLEESRSNPKIDAEALRGRELGVRAA